MCKEENDAKRERWSGIIEQWRISGLSKAEFCRRHDLRECQFHYWHRRIEVDTVSLPRFAHVTSSENVSGLRFRFSGSFELAETTDHGQ